ncbi:MAG: NAD-dependent epimerase/dehydratase family protein, partial [Candidatus Dormibacteraceae bacterium]
MQANELNSALVTGGAGLIGSHLVDLLINQGWRVRILDRLEPQTHAGGAPSWINPKAELMQGDIQDKSCLRAALE